MDKMDELNICVSCYYARMRRDICGIYCVGEAAKKPDGTCDRYLNWKQAKKIRKENNDGVSVQRGRAGKGA